MNQPRSPAVPLRQSQKITVLADDSGVQSGCKSPEIAIAGGEQALRLYMERVASEFGNQRRQSGWQVLVEQKLQAAATVTTEWSTAFAA